MKKITIKNRKKKNIVVLIDETVNQKGLAFVMHGLGGFKEQIHIETFAKAFKNNGYTTIRFDTTNSLGESDGDYPDATTTNYYEDLEDTIEWSTIQGWYQEPFWLAGHSLGSICILLYAEKYPNRVKALAPISTVVSGSLSYEAHDKEKDENWKKTGWLIEESRSKPGVTKKLKWSHMEDRLKYDVLKEADMLTMPVLLIVGENDNSTPPEHQKILYEALPGKKELHIIKNAPHTFYEKAHLDEISSIFEKWIKKYI